MADDSQLEAIEGEIRDHFRSLANGFQKLDKIKDPNRQSKHLEELTGKMRECKRWVSSTNWKCLLSCWAQFGSVNLFFSLIKEYDLEIKDAEGQNALEVNEQLNEKKQSMIKELNSYVALRKRSRNLTSTEFYGLFALNFNIEPFGVQEHLTRKMKLIHGMRYLCVWVTSATWDFYKPVIICQLIDSSIIENTIFSSEIIFGECYTTVWQSDHCHVSSDVPLWNQPMFFLTMLSTACPLGNFMLFTSYPLFPFLGRRDHVKQSVSSFS